MNYSELLEIICCPTCKGNLEEKEDALTCPQCEVAFPIVNQIPKLLVEEARPLKG